MIMSWIWTGLVAFSLASAFLLHRGSALASAIPEGAGAGLRLAAAIGGSMCLWTGVGKLMEKSGITGFLSRLLGPVLYRLFPSCRKDSVLSGYLCGNVCANLLGLGNAATPQGIGAARRLNQNPDVPGKELCRLVVLNTASIQLIPANVAAIRASLGSQNPFDILPCVWLTSLCSAFMGLCAAWAFGKLWKD